jgi:hypothetical protein
MRPYISKRDKDQIISKILDSKKVSRRYLFDLRGIAQ